MRLSTPKKRYLVRYSRREVAQMKAERVVRAVTSTLWRWLKRPTQWLWTRWRSLVERAGIGR